MVAYRASSRRGLQTPVAADSASKNHVNHGTLLSVMMRFPNAVTAGLCLIASFGCNSADTKLCHQKMTEAQNVVNVVESNSVDSLTRSIQMIGLAEAACSKAGRDTEVKELTQARERLEGHRVLVEERADRKKSREALTPAQIDRLVREGDPNCPKGQAYQNKASNKEIRCTGPQPVEMTWEQAKKYFSARNFRSVATGESTVLTLESGAERYVFRYAQPNSSNPATCVVIYSRPGISWQETVARNTGVAPEKLKNGGTVAVAQSKLLLVVDEQNQVARMGDCPK
jgi:hypothetical protein